MNSLITGIRNPEMEVVAIIGLIMLTVALCVVFWFQVLQPVGSRFEYEHVIADFRREIAEWEHGRIPD